MGTKRAWHACGRIYTRSSRDEDTSTPRKMTVIVVGGMTGVFNSLQTLSSVEILDDSSNTWRAGPELPIPIKSAASVNDLSGGLLVIGGTPDGKNPLASIYRLADAAEKTTWVKLRVKLSRPRFDHVALIVPSSFAMCGTPSKRVI